MGEMTFPRWGVRREHLVMDTLGMDIFFVVEFVREAAVTVWPESALGLLVLGCIGALVDV